MLSERLQNMRESVRRFDHARFRQSAAPVVWRDFDAAGLSWTRRVSTLLERMCAAEQPVVEPDQRILFTRTVPAVPLVYDDEQWGRQFDGGRAHELGPISNLCADWGSTLRQGLLGRRAAALAAREKFAADPAKVEFLDAAVQSIDAVLGLAARYAAEARKQGSPELAEILDHVPARAPRSFHEALQSLRLLHATVWMNGHYHVGLGRFDQYMMPYLQADLDAGRLAEPEARELLAEFFISLNRDSDLYPGVQQGDNGQSLMLGGTTRDGECAENLLTRMVLQTAHDVNMIDPKINLRVTSDTSLETLDLAAELTRRGLGFPQYSNDEVVIPGLLAHGYAPEDARDYTVAACWEYIIPGKGAEVVNIGAVSFPAAVNQAVLDGLPAGDDFPALLERVAANIRRQTAARVADYANLILPPAPYYSALMTDSLERGIDLAHGNHYNNYGLHGACSANAADALAAVRAFVFEQGTVGREELVRALRTDYAGAENLRQRLAQGPKVGNNDPAADDLLVFLFDRFAAACAAVGDNGRGGRVRPGTGSAMYYVWLARGHEGMHEPAVGATADGRHAGGFFSSSLAPSPGARVAGPLSLLQTYAKLDYTRICNGGPITLELSDAVFRNPATVRKVALLVRAFAQLGCQQLQLNTLDAAKLEDAKAHPEQHRDLIVRVWGWSGYFCELAPEYQDHVIARHKHQL
ncbi:MAG: pyruvate formate lyase family protein [Lentisphaeria bacterium]|nr:pyruvate formate lyase family protein [Lentisphaeria bacterium]